jgi:hypothetical protein
MKAIMVLHTEMHASESSHDAAVTWTKYDDVFVILNWIFTNFDGLLLRVEFKAKCN